ncbi:MAG TPA: biliverdin-producing heme oxygenase [Polyangia bacterium]
MQPAIGGTAPEASMREALRAATSSRHARLDSAVAFTEDISRATYRGFLIRISQLVVPLEARLHAIESFVARLPAAHQRQKAAALRADLAALGHAAWPPLPARIPVIAGEPAAWGCAYVLEGATLGGTVLARKFGPRLALTPDHGLAYWTFYGEQTSARWRTFLDALEAWAAKAGRSAQNQAVQSAVATFDAFLELFAAEPGEPVERAALA